MLRQRTSTRSNPPVNYETITCHYIDKCTWDVKTVNLETRPLGSASTAENLKSNLKRVMQEWSIYPSGITTDNASNVTKAMKLLQNLDDELLAYETEEGPSPFDDDSDYDDDSEQLLQEDCAY